ncbi:Maf-like protein [Bacteroidia bacterium]|nr:Maf-like protein [Bacteroidia bacterium]
MNTPIPPFIAPAMQLVLASQSPRRRELMQGLDIPFTVAPAYQVDETYPASLSQQEIPVFLAKKKAEEYPYPIKNQQIIVSADTLVWCKGQFLGKPKDEADARQMLQGLSGGAHEVLTGLCLRSLQRTHTFLATTRVWFCALTEAEINYYLQRYAPYDKAGAYGIQEWIGYVGIERIEGSYFNVMGLPVQMLYRELQNFK